ncbi:MAG: gliding motility-associated C-terminal domain-containing protein [Bacteroidetes bacterium]|nr:gliding motility-associated C-terminal domain-containing protein [Bacteroidota bacterium]
MKKFVFFLHLVVLVIYYESFAQSAGVMDNPQNILVLRVNANDSNSKSVNNIMRILSAQGCTSGCGDLMLNEIPSKTMNCNMVCGSGALGNNGLIEQLDSIRLASVSGKCAAWMIPAWVMYIHTDINSTAQNYVEIRYNGNAVGYMGPTNPGAPWQYLGPMTGSNQISIVIGYYARNQTNTVVDIKFCDTGNNGSFNWNLRDMVKQSNLQAGTFTFPGTCKTVTFNLNQLKGIAGFSCTTCPVGSLMDYKNGRAYFCPTAPGVKPGKYPITYNWNNTFGCVKSITDTITVVSIYNTTWSPPASVCESATPINLNNYLSGSADAGGIWSGSGVSGNNWVTAGLSGSITLNYTVGTGTTCEKSESHTIIVNAKPTVNITPGGSTNFCSGKPVNLTLTASGTNSYIWSTSQTGAVITVTPSITTSYTVTGTNSQGCVSTRSITVVINPSPSVSISGKVNVKCTNGSNGSISSTVTSGTPTFSYRWSTNSTSNNLTGITAGSYTLTVTDNKGCTVTTSVTITQPSSAVTLSVPVTTGTGCGSNNGTATASASGGTGAITYLWSPGNKTGSSITGLAAGIYTVTATDANGCTATSTATVAPPSGGPAITLISKKNVKCNGSANGSIFISAPGSISYSWNTGATTDNITNIGAGIFTVTVTNTNTSCSSIRIDTISAPPAYNMNPVITNVICKGSTTGSINITPTGNNGSYSFDWSTVNKQTEDISGLKAGTYTLTITDIQGCSAVYSYTITEPATGITSSLSEVNIKCKGSATGSINSNVTSGTPTYTYNWSNNSTSKNLTGLTAGSYTLTINDSKGCSSIASATITQPSTALILTTLTSTATGCGANTGTATASATNGTGTLTYLWNPGGKRGGTITGLAAGTYVITVTDANGCSITGSVTVAPPVGGPVITNNPPTNIKCHGDLTGNIYTTATGGSGNYIYSWSSGGASGTGNSSNIIGVGAGNYTITYTDISNSCSNFKTITITEPPAFNMAPLTTNILCKGSKTGSINITPTGNTPTYIYDWSPVNKQTEDITGLNPGVYVLSITDSQGCTATFSYTITEPALGITLSVTSTPSNCAASTGTAAANASGGSGVYTYLWSNGNQTSLAGNLAAGLYIVTVTDSKGCAVTASVSITNPNAPVIKTTSTNASCGQNNGTATVSVTGGANPVTYSWNFGSATSATISNLSGGTYVVVVTDANGCSVTGTASITASPNPSADFTPSVLTGDSPLTVDFVSTTSNATKWTWDFGDGQKDTVQSPNHTYTSDGRYNACLLATSANGCKDSICKTIEVSGFLIVIPNVFTPNGDSRNDVFKVTTKGIRNLEMSIWNRWGLKIIETNGPTATWNGLTSAEKECVDGTYLYMIRAFRTDEKVFDYTGFITLIR